MAKHPKKPRSLSPIGNYEVGYCKPPKEHQFQPNQPSANRAGRPRGSVNKVKANPLPIADIPLNRLILEEAMRPVQVREGDKVITIPALQAGVRVAQLNARRGSNPAMRNVHRITSEAYARERAEMADRIEAAIAYKEAATARLKYCKRKGIRFDWDFHPDDVHIDHYTGDVMVVGLMSQEERTARIMMFEVLDFAQMKIKELAEQIRGNPTLLNERNRLGLFIMLIDRTNAWLPRHYHEAVASGIRELASIPN